MPIVRSRVVGRQHEGSDRHRMVPSYGSTGTVEKGSFASGAPSPYFSSSSRGMKRIGKGNYVSKHFVFQGTWRWGSIACQPSVWLKTKDEAG